jgi:ketosteroid isomerase-like protein
MAPANVFCDYDKFILSSVIPLNNSIMKNILTRNLLAVILMASIVSCNSGKQDTVKEEPAAAPVIDKEQIKKDIQAKEDEFAATYNAGVIKDIGYYADDAISFSPNRPPIVGKKAIVEYLTSDLSTNTNKISFKTNEVFVSNDANQVVEFGTFKLVDSTNKQLNSGTYMSLFEKRNGKYVSVRDMSASDMPTPIK